MSESFLSRWSRRKRAAITSPRLRGEVDTPERSEGVSGEGGPPPVERVERAPHPDPLPASGERENAPGESEPTFDPASLPPLESIEAGTDVSAFLRPGVPADLAQAALRRAWVADPAVRDFVGLAENAWDFNAPGGVPGFGPLRAIDDVQRLAAHVAGVVSTVTPEIELAEKAGEAEPAPQETVASSLPDITAPEPDDDAAAHKDVPAQEPKSPRPRHGSALPE
jgi:Protein of unknown function (DUF3306)